MNKLESRTNIENRVRNTKLPRTKPLIPLFELISNAIHSTEEAIDNGLIDQGKIKITVLREGNQEYLIKASDLDNYKIVISAP